MSHVPSVTSEEKVQRELMALYKKKTGKRNKDGTFQEGTVIKSLGAVAVLRKIMNG